jgi:hypothetical protein
MARATQRSSTSPSAPPDPPPSRRSNVPDSPFVSDPTEAKREELPPPYEDASGFIDLDKLRAAAAAQAASRPPSFAPPPPASKGPRTPPPTAASIFATPQPVHSGPSQTMGMIIGGSIAAAGLVAAFFIVSRSNSAAEARIQAAAQHPVAMNTAAPAAQPIAAQPAAAPPLPVAPQPATTPQPIAAQPVAEQPAAASAPAAATQEPATAPAAPAGNAAAHAAPAHAAAAETPSAAAHETATLDGADPVTKGKGKAAAKVAARGAKSEAPKADTPAYDPPKEAPAAGGSFLQALGKTPELAGQAAAAPPPAAPAAAPEPPALPAAPTAPKTGLASAIQKAGGGETSPPAAAPPTAGVPDTPSPGAIASALAANNRAAKACVKGQETPSRASVTFGSDGKVQTITVSGGAVGTPAEDCIKQALQKGSVPPFSKPSYNVGITIRP